jgi:hypothetical protein
MTIDELTAAFAPGQLVNGTIPTVSAFAPCLHEQCMAWRWADAGMDAETLHDSCRADDNLRGYCGPAGTPLSLR